MLRSVIALAFVVASFGVASAESPTWTDVQRACGTEYREADKASRSDWPTFLNECKGRKGFVPKRTGKVDFRLPDVAKPSAN